MELWLLRIWILVVTFCFGISVSALWRIYTLPVLPIPVVDLTTSPREALAQTQPIEPVTNNLSDGGGITLFCRTFKSRAAATQELEKRLRNATILERTRSIDSNGDEKRQEIIITAPFVSLSKDGRRLCVTEASSLEHLRWFEGRTKG